MKKLVLILTALCFLSSPAFARYQRGYYKPSSRAYVGGHYKTRSDGIRSNNYSTKGNFNPYTGKKGYASPYRSKSVFGNKKVKF